MNAVLPPEVFTDRRRQLMDRVGEHGAALFFAAPEVTRSNDSSYDFRQNSDLWYLTGFEEPEAALLVLPGHPKHPVVMFVRKRDRDREVWDGPRAGVEGVKERFGAAEAFPIEEVDTKLPELLEGRERVHYGLGLYPERDRQVVRALTRLRAMAKRGKRAPREIHDPSHLIHELRLFKKGPELEMLRRAIAVSADGHVRAMQATRPGRGEWEVQAEIEYVFRRGGARSPGYTSIVGSGRNACVLHYVANNCRMQDGELLLVDAGAEVGYYTGDITRTWPVSGRFSAPQREIYDLVLKAQLEVIALAKPGLPWSALHEKALRVLTEGMIGLGILKGPVEKALEEKSHAPWYPHSTGHWLGIDVHDVGAYWSGVEQSRLLEPGMVFTVEPGLYFAPDAPNVPERYAGIGVRIEDDVLVTATGHEVLSSGAPKDPAEIEALVGSAP
jgi:Xaa-Pro aminopeptidase